MDELFDIIDDDVLTLDDDNVENENSEKEDKEDSSVLGRYGESLTDRSYITNPAIAREKEIEKTILTILTPDKSAILVGKAGIGKTAIVEGIAYRIQNGTIPDALRNYRIVKVNTSSLLGTYITEAGTEELRINILLKEVEKQEKLILFIDEIHTLVIESRNSGIDFVNAMKPALSRGDIKVIGATTFDEYNQYLIRDKAFLRRFEKIDVEEPSQETTVKILIGTYPKLEKQTGVKLAYSSFVIENIMKFIVEMTSEYKRVYELGSRYPDNSLALLAKAFSYAKFDNSPYVTFKHIYKAIMNCQSVYPDVIKKEAVRFKETFADFIEKENVDLSDY